VNRVLVDSSAWIDFFRGRADAVRRLDALLSDDRAATTGMIAAEVVSGARTRSELDELRSHFAALPQARPPDDLWDRVAESRFSLARQGVQGHVVDLAIAVTAATSGHQLLTRDRDFVAIARVVTSLDLDLF
jgi:tRNA(fMet)-specific endonuclease VapC